jgi:hypothetical protein
MISSHYSHLADKRDYLRQAVIKVTEMEQSGVSTSRVHSGDGSPSTPTETASKPPQCCGLFLGQGRIVHGRCGLWRGRA